MAKPKRKRNLGSKKKQVNHDPSQLIDSLLMQLPVPPDELPEPIFEIVSIATQEAAGGNFEPILSLLESMNEIDASVGREVEMEIPRLALCSEAARDVLDAIKPDDPVEMIADLAAKAIAMDPDAVDAIVLLGDIAETQQSRVAMYRRASEAAARKDPETVAAVMPFVRLHMSGRLINDGNILEAGEIAREALRENEADPAGARFTLVEICMRLGWHEELEGILNRFPEDDLGPLDFARALLAYARNGRSRRANALLAAAIENHPGVAEYLAGSTSMPRVGDRLTEEQHYAVQAAEYLLPGLREFEGAVAWIRETAGLSLLANDKDDDGRSMDFGAEYTDDELLERAQTDPLEVALGLPPGESTWQLVIDRNANTGSSTLILLDGGELVAAKQVEKRPSTRDLRDFALQSVTEPIRGRPRKPNTIRVPTKANVTALEKWCGTFGVEVVQEKLSREESRQLEPVLEMISRQMAEPEQRDLSVDAIQTLAETDETWLYGVFQPPMWIHDGPTPRRMFMQLVLDTNEGFVLHHEITESAPQPKTMADSLKSAMISPAMGDPRRVRRVMIDPQSIGFTGDVELEETLGEQLDGIEIMRGDDQLTSYFNKVVADMLSHGNADKAIYDIDGVDTELLDEFYRVLANFYRAKPWKMVSGDQLFDVSCASWSTPTRTACVIGQLGQEFGIAVYDSPSAAQRIMTESVDETNYRSIVVHYGEEFDTIPVDTWHRERNGWEVAGKEAHPFVARIVNPRQIDCVSAEDVRVLMGILPSVPRFLDHPRDTAMEVEGRFGKITFKWCDRSW